MCNFFSFCSVGDGKLLYFDWTIREKILKKELTYEADSHTSIADYFGYKGEKEDKLNKYEYNPLTKIFNIDCLGIKDDSKEIQKAIKKLDWKKIIPALIIKQIVNPLKIKRKMKATKKEIELFKAWISIEDSIRGSVGRVVKGSIWDSVGGSVGRGVGGSIWDSVGRVVGDPIRGSVGDSVWGSVGGSVWDSVSDFVSDFVMAYISSFFNIKFKYDFSSVVKLWEAGLVASFDGEKWRLHAGEKAETIFELEA